MRIISGTHKGRIIHLPKTFKHRPTTDIAKEGLFNILNNIIDFEDIKALDLFSGSGSISFELASRGVEDITSVDNNFKYIDFIKKCSSDFGFDGIKPMKSDVWRFIQAINKKYDLIFADPPFDLKKLDLIPQMIFDNELLSNNGLFILEHSGNYMFNKHDNFRLTRKYGSVNFSFFTLDLEL